MIIKGFQEFTLIDYPDKTACIVFTAGCNFRCPYCYNAELVLPEKKEGMPEISQEQIFSFLKKRKGKLDGVVVTGGEPSVHDDLLRFCNKIKKMGFLVKIDTNGSNPEVIKELLRRKAVDYIAMDVKLPLSRYDEICSTDVGNIRESIEIIKNSPTDYEFRTTVVPGLHSEEDIEEIGKEIEGAKKYFLQNFLPDKTLDSSFLEKKPFTEKDLVKLKAKAVPFVKKCEVR